MSDKTSIIISSVTTGGVAKQKTIPYVNPDASNADALAFAQGLNDLTTRTYIGTARVDRTELDTAGPGKSTPTFTFTKTTYTTAELDPINGEIPFTFDGDGIPYAFIKYPDIAQGAWLPNICAVAIKRTVDRFVACIKPNYSEAWGTATIYVRCDETENYKAAEAIITVTA